MQILKTILPWWEWPFLKVDQWYRDYNLRIQEKKKNELRKDYQAMFKMFMPMYNKLKAEDKIPKREPDVPKPPEMSHKVYYRLKRRPCVGSWTWYVKNVRDTGEYGIPQGWALSPMLANLSIAPIAMKFKNCLFYVDDGIMIAGKEENIKLEELMDALEKKGMTLAARKFGWVKHNGKWLKDLVFLGMKYQWKTQEWQAWTKSGKRMTVPRPPMSVLNMAKGISSANLKIATWLEVNKQVGTPVDLLTWAYQNGQEWTQSGEWVDIDSKTLWQRIMRKKMGGKGRSHIGAKRNKDN